MMKNHFSTYYSNEGSLIWGGFFSSGHKMAGGGETGMTPKYKMRDKVKLRVPYDHHDENGNTVTITTEDIGVIKYRDDEGKEQEFSEWMEDIKEQNKIHGHVGYFVKFPKILSYIWMEESSIMPSSGREVLYRKIINFIKYEIEVRIENIPSIRDWDTLEELHDVPYINIFGRKWNGYFRNYSSSTTIEKIEEKFPKNKTLLKLASIYRDYNMNDFYGGTKKQNEALKKWYTKENKFDLDGRYEYLKSVGLYEDRGYIYGTDWLYKPVPASVVEELKLLSEQLSNEFMAGGGEVGGNYQFKNELGSFTSVKIMPVDENLIRSQDFFTVEIKVRVKRGESIHIQTKSKTFPISQYDSYISDLKNRGAKKMNRGGSVESVTRYYKIQYDSLDKFLKFLKEVKPFVDSADIFFAGIGEVYLKIKGYYDDSPYSSDEDDFHSVISRNFGFKYAGLNSKPTPEKRWEGKWRTIDEAIKYIEQ